MTNVTHKHMDKERKKGGRKEEITIERNRQRNKGQKKKRKKENNERKNQRKTEV